MEFNETVNTTLVMTLNKEGAYEMTGKQYGFYAGENTWVDVDEYGNVVDNYLDAVADRKSKMVCIY